MDLHSIETVCRPRRRSEIPGWQAGDVYLAGGTWLFSEPQADPRRLVDLTSLGWEPLRITGAGLDVAATCTIARLNQAELPAAWRAAPLIDQCCRALLGSFKVWNVATVGGNLCMALPAGPLIAMAAALEGVCTIWGPDGGERLVPVMDFVSGPQENALRPGELLRSIALPDAALRRRTAFRRISLSPDGRSGALAIGTLGPTGDLVVTVTASTRRPVRIGVPRSCRPGDLRSALEATIASADWYDDPHGWPEWRAHVTSLLVEEVRAELAGDGGS